ncbi:unnamed protein product, partial [Aphanomyces euteiches]
MRRLRSPSRPCRISTPPHDKRLNVKITPPETHWLRAAGQRATEDLLRLETAKKWRPVQTSEMINSSDGRRSDSGILLTQTADNKLFTLRGTTTIHATAADVVRVLCIKEPVLVQKAFCRFFGTTGTLVNVYFQPEDDNSASNRVLSVETLELQSTQLGELDVPQTAQTSGDGKRKYAFLRYSQPLESTADDLAGRSLPRGSAVCIWETVDMKSGPKAGNAAFHKCGFLVEPSSENQVRLTFYLSHALDASGSQGSVLSSAAYFILLRMIRSTLRSIHGAIVDYRIHNITTLPKSVWNDGSHCSLCAKPFKLFRPKHHCRHCGDVVCTSCSMMRDARDNQSLRACMPCVEGHPSCMMRHSSKLSQMPSQLIYPSPNDPKRANHDDVLQPDLYRQRSEPSLHKVKDVKLKDASHRLRPVVKTDPTITPDMRNEPPTKSMFDPSEFDGLVDPKLGWGASSPLSSSVHEKTHAPERGKFITDSSPLTYHLSFKHGRAWPDPPEAPHEGKRLRKAQTLGLFRRHDEANTYVKMTCRTMQCPVGALTIIGQTHGHVIAKVGIDGESVSNDIMFDSHVIMSSDPLVVLDCLDDLRFMTNPLVCEGSPGIRFYVGVPLIASD